MTKQELRKAMREAKASHSHDELSGMSHSVCHTIASDIHWQRAATVLLYHPLPDEADITPLIAQGKEDGKTILLPIVAGDSLTLRKYEDERTLRTGAYGIKEPAGQDFSDYASIDLVVVPGMAFDNACHRLGRGKGFYDRLLPRLARAYRIGACFPFQMVNDVPHEAHDCSVNRVIFE